MSVVSHLAENWVRLNADTYPGGVNELVDDLFQVQPEVFLRDADRPYSHSLYYLMNSFIYLYKHKLLNGTIDSVAAKKIRLWLDLMDKLVSDFEKCD